MSIAAVVLAAGASRRLGRPKQTLVLNAETLLDRAVRVANESGLSPVIVVLHKNSELERPLCERGCDVVINEQASTGMASSICCGVDRAAKLGVRGIVLMTCDQVALRAEHLCKLSRDPNQVRGSGYGGKIGVPAYFPASSFAALLRLRDDEGARELLRNAEFVVEERLAFDVDMEADIRRAEELLQD